MGAIDRWLTHTGQLPQAVDRTSAADQPDAAVNASTLAASLVMAASTAGGRFDQILKVSIQSNPKSPSETVARQAREGQHKPTNQRPQKSSLERGGDQPRSNDDVSPASNRQEASTEDRSGRSEHPPESARSRRRYSPRAEDGTDTQSEDRNPAPNIVENDAGQRLAVQAEPSQVTQEGCSERDCQRDEPSANLRSASIQPGAENPGQGTSADVSAPEVPLPTGAAETATAPTQLASHFTELLAAVPTAEQPTASTSATISVDAGTGAAMPDTGPVDVPADADTALVQADDSTIVKDDAAEALDTPTEAVVQESESTASVRAENEKTSAVLSDVAIESPTDLGGPFTRSGELNGVEKTSSIAGTSAVDVVDNTAAPTDEARTPRVPVAAGQNSTPHDQTASARPVVPILPVAAAGGTAESSASGTANREARDSGPRGISPVSTTAPVVAPVPSAIVQGLWIPTSAVPPASGAPSGTVSPEIASATEKPSGAQWDLLQQLPLPAGIPADTGTLPTGVTPTVDAGKGMAASVGESTAPRAEAARHSPSGHGLSATRELFSRQIAPGIGAARNDGREVTLRLNPPELGSLRIEVAVRDQSVVAVLGAQRPETRQLLSENLPLLREALQQQGFGVDRIEVSVADGRFDGSGGASNGNSGSGQFSGQGFDQPPTPPIPEQHQAPAARNPIPVPKPHLGALKTGIDVQV